MDSSSPSIDLRIDGKNQPKNTQKPQVRPQPPPTTASLVVFPPLPTKKTAPKPILIGAMAVPTQPPSAALVNPAIAMQPPSTAPRVYVNQDPIFSRTPAAQVPSTSRSASAHINTACAGSNIIKAYHGSFDFKPQHRLQGIPCLSFGDFDKVSLLSKIKNIVIVKFSHNRPKYVDFCAFLETKKFEKGYKVVEYDKKHVFVVFESFHDFVKLWVMRSVLIKGFKARFFCWDEHFNPYVESFLAPVWIHLPGLPIFMFDEEVVLSIGALFGRTLFIDPACLNKDKIGVLSFCVSMDVRENKLKEFWVEFVGEGINVSRFLQRVVYGDIPPFCSSCKHLGHSNEYCKMVEAVTLKGKLNGKKEMQEVTGKDHVIPTVSVFGRLGVLSASTKGKELGESSTAQGRNLEEVEVVDITEEENFASEQQKSATVAATEPTLKPNNFLCGDKGENPAGVLETRVNNLQISRRFEPLAVLDEEKTSVENGVLQQKTADCFEEATLVDDNSQTRQDEGGNSASLDRQVNILQNPKKMRAKMSTSHSESVLENRVLQNSSADSDEEATLLEDFSQLRHPGGEFPSVSQRQAGNLQVAERIKVKSLLVCPENRLEVGTSLQTAADFCDRPTLGAHNSQSRNNQVMTFGSPESSTKGLQNDTSLDLPAATSDEIYSDESGSSTVAVPFSNEHNLGSGGATDLILGPTESQEDYLQSQGENQVSNMLVNQVYPSKVVITHPVTKEVIVLSPTSQSLSAPKSTSAVGGMSKSERKKWKKKKRREAEQKGKSVVEPLSSSNASKDISVFDDLVYPVITVISEDEACTGTYIPRHSRLHPSYKERSSKFNSLDYLDLHEVWATKRKDTDTMGKGLFETPYKADEALLVTLSSSGIPKVVSSSATKDQTGEALQPVIYSKEELAAKIIEKLNLSKYEEMQIELHNVVQQQIDKLGKRCPWNDRAVNIIVDWYINAMIWNTPDKKPPKYYQDYLRSIKKDKIRKDMIEPASQVKSDYNLRSKIKTQRKDSSYTKFFKENFVPP